MVGRCIRFNVAAHLIVKLSFVFICPKSISLVNASSSRSSVFLVFLRASYFLPQLPGTLDDTMVAKSSWICTDLPLICVGDWSALESYLRSCTDQEPAASKSPMSEKLPSAVILVPACSLSSLLAHLDFFVDEVPKSSKSSSSLSLCK